MEEQLQHIGVGTGSIESHADGMNRHGSGMSGHGNARERNARSMGECYRAHGRMSGGYSVGVR